MKKSDITGGLLLILLAAFLILNKFGVLPDIQWFKLIFTVFMGYITLRSIPKLDFFGIIMPLCLIGCVYDKQLGIEAITPWTLLFSGVLLSIGLGMIFKRKRHYKIGVNVNEHMENCMDGEVIRMENNFNSVSKYVNSNSFREAHMENNFGSTNVYFNNAVMSTGNARIVVENSFGETNLYFPQTWRMVIEDRDVSFGDIKIHGMGNADMDAPCVTILAECNFGTINIYFE